MLPELSCGTVLIFGPLRLGLPTRQYLLGVRKVLSLIKRRKLSKPISQIWKKFFSAVSAGPRRPLRLKIVF